MIPWKMFLGDGSTFDSTQGTPADAPGSNVVCIMQPSIYLGREILYRWPCYYWSGTLWERGTHFGIFDRLLAGLPVEAYCEGVLLDEDSTKTLWESAFNDSTLGIPNKNARDGAESPWATEPDYVIDAIPRTFEVERPA